MWRYVSIFLFGLLLVVPFVLSRSVGRPVEDQLAERLVIVTPHPPQVRREFGEAFYAWHLAHYGKPVVIDFRAVGSTQDIVRFLKASFAVPGAYRDGIGIDMAWGGGNTLFDHDLPREILAPLNLPGEELKRVFPSPDLAGVKLYDSRWVGVCLSSFGIVYNPQLCRQLGVGEPRTWGDLADPKLAGYVALADPTHSGSVAICYMMVIQRAMADEGEEAGFERGMRTLTLMAANSRYFSDQAPQPVNDVASAEAAEGVAIDYYAGVTAEMVGGDRLKFVAPAGATAVTPDPIAILAGTSGRRRELADHFVEFLLSPEGQRLWILKAGTAGGPRESSMRRAPIRRDVYLGDRSNWTEAGVDLFSSAGGFNLRNEWMWFFTDIRPVWAAAWIDDADDLHGAYAKVLAVSDLAKREKLLAELAELPITLADLKADGISRKGAGDPQLWSAERRIEWGGIFREHYRAVGREAGEP